VKFVWHKPACAPPESTYFRLNIIGYDSNLYTYFVEDTFYAFDEEVVPYCDYSWYVRAFVTGRTSAKVSDWAGGAATVLDQCANRGDYDHDTDVDSTDMVLLYTYVFANGFYPGCWDEADVDSSGSIDVSDLTFLVPYLFWGGDPPPGCGFLRSSSPDQSVEVRSDIDGDGIEDSLDNCPFAFNPDQTDSDSNGIGDQCDVDCGNVDGLSGQGGPVDLDDLVYLLEWLFENGPSPVQLLTANIGGCTGLNVYDLQVLRDYLFAGPGFLHCWHQINCDPIVDSNEVILDHLDGLLDADTIVTDHVITFHVRLKHHSLEDVQGLTNGFRVFSPTGAMWGTTVIEGVFDLGQYYDLASGMRSFSITGNGVDTVGFYAAHLFTQSIPGDFDTVTHTISIGPIDKSYSGGVICLDSSWFPPSNDWIWASCCPNRIVYPTWDGPHCFNILYCCEPRGDLDHQSGVNIADLTYLVAFLFQNGDEPVCVDQGNVDDLVGPGGPHDVADLTYLVAYLFQGGAAPPLCSQ
jgi:hypothetical protein